jgi:hypothetical protein
MPLDVVQNYFGDAWNVLDFVIVVGSIIDIVIEKLMVRHLANSPQKRVFSCKIWI